MDTDQWLQDYSKRVAELQQASEQVKEDLAGASVTVSSPDQAVTVTVGPNGSLLDLKFGPSVGKHSLAQLSGVVMHTVAAAQRSLADRVAASLAPFGDAGATASQLVASYRPEDDDAEDRADEQPVEPVPLAPPTPQAPPAPSMPQAAAPPRARPARAQVDEDDEVEERPW